MTGSPRRLPSLLLSLAGLACASPNPGEPRPSEPTPPQTGAVEQPGRGLDGPLRLHAIAAREGDLSLARVGERAYLMMDGEPIPLAPGAAPTRAASLAAGLHPRASFLGGPGLMTVALGGALDQGRGYLTTREDFDRAGSRFDSYTLTSAGWQPHALGQGPLQGYYQALVTLPGGALLGLRAFEVSFGELPEIAYDDSPESAAWWAELERQRATAPAGFEVLAGSPAAVPELPAGWVTTEATATATGRIVAIAYQPDPAQPFASAEVRLLAWAPGATEAEVSSLPELDETTSAYSVRLWPAGERVLATAYQDTAGGPGPYLAIGDGQGWRPIPVELPGLEPPASAISSAALGPDGQPWITLGSWFDPVGPTNTSLWRYDAGVWLAVELPAVAPELWAGGPRWVQDVAMQTWVELPGGVEPEPALPSASAVVWAGDTLWVVARAGRAYPGAEQLYAPDPRTIVYASSPLADAAPSLLPSYDAVVRERRDQRARTAALRPGEPDCERFTLVAVDRPATRKRERDAVIATLRGAASLPDTGDAQVIAAYLGTPLDDPDHDQLILDAQAWNPASAAALQTLVERELGVSVSPDCRPRQVTTMLRQGPW